MVYGNLNSQSGHGTAYSRNVGTGENLIQGEFYHLSAGDDSGAGGPHVCIRT